jgi:diguanylate cyclase (GGDEF)-like protein/PAS domain S-box-containing protein
VSRAINLLLAEDSEDDARLVLLELKRGGFTVRHERVESAAALTAALQRPGWDAVISDYNMPGFTGLDALAILKASRADIPFIVVSGTIGEEIAVQAMKAGASDYVMKKDLARLAPALKRELKEATARAGHRQAEIELRKLSLAVRQSGTAIMITDPAGAIEFVNPKFEAITGYSAAEVKGKNPRFLKSGGTPPDTYRDLWETIAAGKEWRGELQNRKKTGEPYFEKQYISPVFDANGATVNFIAVKEDVTELKRANDDLQRFRAAMDMSGDSIYVTDLATMRFVYLNITACQRLGYTREQLLQKGPQDVLPMDREQIRGEYDVVIAAEDRGVRHESRFIRSDGSEGWTELQRRAMRTEGGTLIVTIGRDITERKQAEDRIRRLNRVYAVLSGINALIVRVSDRKELFGEACRIAVDLGGFPIAWIGEVDREAMQVRPVAWRGTDERLLGQIRMTIREDAPGGIGVVGRTVRDRKPVISNDIEHDPQVPEKGAMARGARSMASLPLVVGGEGVGVLRLYSDVIGFFDDEEMKLLTELAGDISFALDHIEKANELAYLAYYDGLTGLANRTLFHERLSQYVHVADQREGKLALVLADVERFKAINDSLGRQAGDELLKQLAGRLGQATDPGNIARIGGDHFALVLPEMKGRSEVVRTVAAIWRDCFAQPFQLSGNELRIAAKAGIALFPGDGTDADALFASAEAALRKAQETGERHLFHTPDLTSGVADQLALENQLRQALEKEEFVLHYQPKVDLETRAIVGVEALIRWQSPQLGLVPPMKFILLLEETGLIQAVGSWALKRASLDHRKWVNLGLKTPRVAVNVSPIQLRQRDFVGAVEQAIIEGVAPTGIDLEITESLIMEDVQGSIEKLKAVRGLGVGIAIDDFGTGYSSLGYLAKLPVQTLKIDRSFIITMLDDPDTMTLVSTIISLAHSLRLKVVAEGVDKEEQAKMLRLLRCDEMQGYLYSKPVPFEQMTALLQQAAKA